MVHRLVVSYGTPDDTAAFDAVDTVRSVLTILEEQLVVVSLLRDVLDRGLNVAIGSETGIEPLVDSSLRQVLGTATSTDIVSGRRGQLMQRIQQRLLLRGALLM